MGREGRRAEGTSPDVRQSPASIASMTILTKWISAKARGKGAPKKKRTAAGTYAIIIREEQITNC
jgi:hypothetical protein